MYNMLGYNTIQYYTVCCTRRKASIRLVYTAVLVRYTYGILCYIIILCTRSSKFGGTGACRVLLARSDCQQHARRLYVEQWERETDREKSETVNAVKTQRLEKKFAVYYNSIIDTNNGGIHKGGRESLRCLCEIWIFCCSLLRFFISSWDFFYPSNTTCDLLRTILTKRDIFYNPF